ncbi:MAG: hypothetical protein ACRDFW_09560 [bacterium]
MHEIAVHEIAVHEIAPVFLKNEGRIDALFTLYFLALRCRPSSSASYASR